MTKMRYNKSIGHSLRTMMELDPAFRSVAYFSMEIGLDAAIPTYSGGLGVLAGDILKSSADLGVPMLGITLLYRQGYFQQKIDAHGNQVESPVTWQPESQLTLLPNEVTVQIENRDVRVRAWCYEITGNSGYPLPVYFLDTDVDGNDIRDRQLSACLYGGDQYYRLCQEIILGVGGLRMIRDLGYNNVSSFHLNEGHAGFLTLELLREQGYESYDKIREQVVFTTHTPVPAGHDHFRYELIDRIMSPVFASHLKRMMPPEGVSMTELGLRYSHYVNGVSKKHADVSRDMFDKPDIDAVTNGVHLPTWASAGVKRLFDRHISGWRDDPGRLVQALHLPEQELWNAHQAAKMHLFAKILETTERRLDPEILTIGFGRRAATYKRADLLLSDVKRLIGVAGGKVQLVFAGKAHPNDEGGKAMIHRINQAAKDLGVNLPIVFMENYDMEIGALMTAGVDVWLNNPRRPREASGTSGMKCALNGVLNFSVLDGWWLEGWVEDCTGWSIGPEPSEADLIHYDEYQDAADIYHKLEDKVIPTYYHHRDKWIGMMKHAIALNASYFNTHRVVREYCEKAYRISFRGL